MASWPPALVKESHFEQKALTSLLLTTQAAQ